MRLGQNPAKFVHDVHKPARVTVAVLTYTPFLSGFFAQGLDVLRLCLESLWADTDVEHDLMVFDNGSCEEVRAFLLEAHAHGQVQFLVLSEKNLGKGGAWNVIFNAAPGDIIAYADSDALFAPHWLSESLRILETFPGVGMVTSRPFRTPEAYLTSTLAWGQRQPEAVVETGSFIPWETFRDFDLSLGQLEEIRQRSSSTQDVRIRYKGVCAHAGASHWQFVAYRSVLQQFVPFSMERPMGQVRQLDERMNDAGLLRLMTCEPLVMNISNTPLVDGAAVRDSRHRPPSGLRNVRWVRRLLLGIYDRIFRWYYAS